VRAAALAALAAVLLDAGVAGAGRRRFAWLWDTDVLPERAVEVEWWITEETGGPSGREAAVYTSGVIGLTDNLELAIPIEVAFLPDGAVLEGYGVDLRWRLAPADPAAAGPLVPFLRIGARRLEADDAAGVEGDVALSLDLSHRVRALVDVGGSAASNEDGFTMTGGLGVSFALIDELQIGAEAYGHKVFGNDTAGPAWVAAGPNLLFTHGRFWLTAALLIGLHRDAPDFMPKVVWAVAL
jgi:hypothetical protein